MKEALANTFEEAIFPIYRLFLAIMIGNQIGESLSVGFGSKLDVSVFEKSLYTEYCLLFEYMELLDVFLGLNLVRHST